MNKKQLSIILITSLAGYLMWQFSGTILGREEAFDSPLYPLALVIVGIFSCYSPWLGYLGVTVGQLVFFTFLSGKLWIVGVLGIFIYSVIVPAIAALVFHLIKSWEWRTKNAIETKKGSG